MNRVYLLFLLALGALDLSWGNECEKGFLMNPKKRKCEPIPPTKPTPKCQRGTVWLPAKKACVRLRQIISGYYPPNQDNTTQALAPCPKNTSELGKLCVKESGKKPGASGGGHSLFLEPEGKYQVFIQELP
ncbi:uncharacterized protein LOC108026600 [Drosophila biarmipes]|uniref:uncharacterized protein LOC108026600 n=1 Tax=Drosophila biarmipes TaxID=125945 RepID=UPI0007E5DF45|nr:uncharacterized protein LOC108026600 [Drosophila biarmipes]